MEGWRIKLRQKNIAIFKDTMEYIESNECPETKQEVFREFDCKAGEMSEKHISVKPNNTIDEALSIPKGRSVAILNFADFIKPGGGVVSGSSAQEECICRCTNLYPSLRDEPLYKEHKEILNDVGYVFNDDIIYTSNVSIIKDAGYEKLAPEDFYTVDVITCCAPNMRYAEISENELKDIMIRRWGNILTIAEKKDIEELILGAWGCGAFKCDPSIVANAFKEAASKIKYSGNITFPIPPRGENYKIFKSILEE